MRLLPAAPLGLGAQQVLLGHHLQDRADVLRHAAVDQHQALLQLPRVSAGASSRVRGCVCVGSRRPRLTPNSGSPSPARTPVDQLDPRPDAAGVLPAAARAAEPLAEDRARRDQAALVLVRAARSAMCVWPVARMQTAIGSQQVGGDRQPRALGDVVDVADELDAAARARRAAPAGRPGSRPSLRCPAGRCPRRSRAAFSRPR